MKVSRATLRLRVWCDNGLTARNDQECEANQWPGETESMVGSGGLLSQTEEVGWVAGRMEGVATRAGTDVP